MIVEPTVRREAVHHHLHRLERDRFQCRYPVRGIEAHFDCLAKIDHLPEAASALW